MQNKYKPIIFAFFAQLLANLAVIFTTPIAPYIINDTFISETLYGIIIGFAFAVSAVLGLFSYIFINALGACRAFAYALVLAAIGCIVAVGGNGVAIVISIGCASIAYSLANPGTGVLLRRASPARYRNLIFSIKQTCVPVGAVMAASLAPIIAIYGHWRFAGIPVAIMIVLILVIFWRDMAKWDSDCPPVRKIALQDIYQTLVQISKTEPRLVAICGASALYCMLQTCLFGFVSILLVSGHDWSIGDAALLMNAMFGGAIFSRLFWGAIADTRIGPLGALRAIGVISACAGGLMLFLGAEISTPMLAALIIVMGMTGIGWNGVFMASLASMISSEYVALATAAGVCVVFLIGSVAPLIYGLLLGAFGAHHIALGCIALLSAFGVILTKLPKTHTRLDDISADK